MNISDIVVRSYFYSLVENNKVEQAEQDAEWIDELSVTDETKINSYLNVTYLLSQKGAFRKEKLIYNKILKLTEKRNDLNQFFISTVNRYAHSLRQTGFQKEGEQLFSNSVSKIENEFDIKGKIDFYLRYAFFVSNDKIKLKKIINILKQERFKTLLNRNKSFLRRYNDIISMLIQNNSQNIINDIEKHERDVDSILSASIHEKRLVYHYSKLSILYDKVNDTIKSKKEFDKLKSIFNRNKTNLNETDLYDVTEAAVYFKDIELALESWKLRLDWINKSICLNYSMTNHQFDSLFEMRHISVFHATGFNMKYGNFPELQKKIITFHELMKKRIFQGNGFVKKLETLDPIPEYEKKLDKYTYLSNSLVINSKEKEKLLYLRRYFSELIYPSNNNDCENININSYKNKRRSILYYTSIEAAGDEFYRLYTLNHKSNLNPLKFYYDLKSKPKRELNDDFTKTQINNLKNLNLDNSYEILISRAADINFVNFQAYKKEIDVLTGTNTKIRLINTLEGIDNLTNKKFTQDVEIILYGDIDFNNFGSEKSETKKNKKNTSNPMSVNLSRSSLRSWTYLPGTLKEISLINDLAKRKNIESSVIDGSNASEISLRSLSDKQNPFVLHLATHGYFFDKIDNKFITNSYISNDDPLIRSGVVLAGANRIWSKSPKKLSDNDGILSSKEIANLDLKNCKLLVLSACDTGLGEFGTDSVEGVQKAFKMAGVDKIIMSLSKVPDSKTPIFFKFFYSELFKGLTIHEAFTNTQREMRKRYGFEDDFWSSFILLE